MNSTVMIVAHSKIQMPTAEAEMSLITLILRFSLVSIKSHSASIALLNNSAIRTNAVAVKMKKKSIHWRKIKHVINTPIDKNSL